MASLEDLFARSEAARKQTEIEEVRQRWKRTLSIALAVLGIMLVGGSMLFAKLETDHQKFLAERTQVELERKQVELQEELRLDYQRQVSAEKESADSARDEAERLRAELARTNLALESARAPAGQPSPAAPLPSLDQATEIEASPVAPSAAASAPQVTVPTAQQSPTGFICEGAIWIGSGDVTNLRAVGTSGAAQTVALSEIQPNRAFVTTANIRLRQGVPAQDGYVHQETSGIVPQGAQVVALRRPVPYQRSAGIQYWLPVRVAGQICSLIYFQFAGGTPDQARALADALTARGYLVPGQEQLRTAQGTSEVRYYYDEDAGRAEQLARDAAAAAMRLGFARSRDVLPVSFTGWRRQKPARGTLELWLDLSPK